MNKVYLVGLPASGKTETGKWLAAKLDWQFLDLDTQIELDLGNPIANIFEESGEEEFRLIEQTALHGTFKLKNYVISTGGGSAAFANNMSWMNEQGLTLYLNPIHEVLVERLILDNEKRPMFMDLKGAEIADLIEELHLERKNFYSKSKLIYNKIKPEDSLYVAVNQLVEIHSSVLF